VDENPCVKGYESMRINSQDQTIKKNYIQKYRFLIREYEAVKAGTHASYRRAQEFYQAHDLDRRTFRKYYNRYLQSGNDEDLLPRKRGPRWKTRRIVPEIEQKVIEQRHKGLSRYEIVSVLRQDFQEKTPSASGVYQVLRRHGLNRLKSRMKEEKRKIIKQRAGELGHIDTYYLSKDLIVGDRTRRYLVSVVDACTRIAWVEMVEDLRALTVMFAVLRMMNILKVNYDIQFQEVLTDNGPEFGTKESQKKKHHPFERLLEEMGVKHRYTRPYRPQTNGKVERFWRTLNEDLIEGTTFENEEDFKKELEHYLYYYNTQRPHQALGGITPLDYLLACPRIT
jgi:transposase InsO family protein